MHDADAIDMTDIYKYRLSSIVDKGVQNVAVAVSKLG